MSAALQKFFTTWQGIALAITAAVGATVALIQALPPLFTLVKRLIDGSVFLLEIQETIRDMRKEATDAFKRLEDGQLNQINARRFNLDADSTRAYFETDGNGKTEWVSRKWRDITGLDNSQARGSGWENGLAPENEERVLRAWQAAIDHQRTFDLVVIYIDRDGLQTPMRVIASPMRDSLGHVIQFHGICQPLTS